MVKMTESLDRPAWTQDDQHAYRNKHTIVRGRFYVFTLTEMLDVKKIENILLTVRC